MAKVKEIRDYIVDENELILPRVPSVRTRKKVSYRVLIQSGCDFVVEKRKSSGEKEKLVILISQWNYYIGFRGDMKRQLTKEGLWEFLKDIPRSGLDLPEVSWIPKLYPTKKFSSELMEVLSDVQLTDFLTKGLAFVPESYFNGSTVQAENQASYHVQNHYLWRDEDYCMNRWTEDNVSPFFEVDSYGMAGIRTENMPIYNPFAGPFDNPQGDLNAFDGNHYYRFRAPGAVRVRSHDSRGCTDGMQMNNGLAAVDPFDPFEDQKYYMSNWRAVLYACKKLANYSPGLYKDMIRVMTKRHDCDIRTLYRDHILLRDTPENRLFRCFHSFIMLRSFFGPEWGMKAMEKYLNSGMEALLPYDFLQKLLYSEMNPVGYQNEIEYRKLKKEWSFKAESFMNYLFDGAVREGFADDPVGYIARWDNVLHFQKLLYGKVVEKYPENLASYEHKLAYKVRAERDILYQKMWDEKAEECAALEYEHGKYKIVAAKSKADLVEESNRQHNCVHSYEGNVLSGKCMIFFMRYADPEKAELSILTIEVMRDGTLGQVKGKCNNAPKMQELTFVQEWAEEKGLRFDENETMAVGW